MLMLLELPPPRVEDGHATDLGPEVLGIARDVKEGLRHGAKEQAVERARIGEDEWAEVLRQGKNGVFVRRIEDFALSVGQPGGSGHALAFGAAAVTTRVIRESLMATGVTAGFVAAQGCRVAPLDGPKRPMLLAAQGMAVSLEESLAMLAHYVGDFQLRPTHES